MNIATLKGDQDKEQYKNLRFLTHGGMGDIYTAQDVSNSCEVAIKIIRIEKIPDKELLQEEFKIATTLLYIPIDADHPFR